ncbi:heme biosynthesis HemY N-terminal domain-containing protein [Zestomonas thermotolerans]|uniref:heme biosynthesis HemY N-terminal domain-containing protein n=1 Tax=Zestomonas thermotolerans TaxID=157784 RepID=UPI0003822EF3|nr:heme biosynthesis HemY N-terminal domain-containing protein [Pseudomonas thermotolerans]
MKVRTRVRVLLSLLLVVAAIAGLVWAFSEHAGYVLIAFKGFRYESSLWAFLAVLAVLWVTLWLLRLVLRLLFVSTGVVNPWSRRNRRRRIRLASEQGLMDLIEGRWERALRHLKRAAEGAEQSLIYYLGAARAAHRLGEYEESDDLLERALQREPQAELAIALAHAELQADRDQLTQALSTLQVMRERHPHHPQLLRQLQAVLVRRGEWSVLVGLLPELRKYRALPEDQLLVLERRVWRERLDEAGRAGLNAGEAALQPLTQAWHHLPAELRQDPELVAAYAEQLRRLGAQEEAESLLRKAIRQHYDSRLVRLYGLVRGSDPAAQLQVAESWLQAHPEDAELLLALGRLSLQNQLWGKARDYFESSLSFARSPQACAELARLLAQLGETARSNQLFLEGLGMLDAQLPSLPQPETART